MGDAIVKIDTLTPSAVLDVDGCLTRFGGDKELFLEMIGMLLEDVPPLLADLTNAIRAGNANAVEGKAHALKGLLMNCGGTRSAQVAERLEDAGHTHKVAHAPKLLQQLEDELDALTCAIHEHRR
jgi:HPt (histidine-containing phosphotransfer) domain-containing protein